MNEQQVRSLATLSPAGRAAVFTEGEDAPILIQVSDVKARLAPVTNDELSRRAGTPAQGRDADCCGQSTAGCRSGGRPEAAVCRCPATKHGSGAAANAPRSLLTIVKMS